MDYGKLIKDIRVYRLEQSQKVFSSHIGVCQSYLSQLEAGNKIPSIHLLERIAEYMNVELSILFLESLNNNRTYTDSGSTYSEQEHIENTSAHCDTNDSCFFKRVIKYDNKPMFKLCKQTQNCKHQYYKIKKQ